VPAVTQRATRFPELPTTQARRFPDALADPLRLAILAGLAVLLVGTLLPWIRAWMPGRGFFEVSGFEGAGDAGIMLELELVIFALTWSSQAWRSKTAILVAGPFFLGVAGLVLTRVAWGEAQTYVRALAPAGGHGELLPWFWLAVLGAVIVTVGGAIEVWRSRNRVSFRVGLSRATLGGTAGGIGGAILGFIGGVQIGGLFTHGALAWVSTSVVVLLALLLMFLGAWVGAMAGASIARSARQ
jgi:hypothetical protein